MKQPFKMLGIATAFAAITGTTVAQETQGPACKPHEVMVGVTGGANMSMFFAGNQEVNKNYNFGIGYQTGVFATYGVTNHLSVLVGGNYSRVTSDRQDMQPLLPNSPYQNGSYALYANYKKLEKLDYIEAPVMARYTIGSKNFKAYANAGCYVGFVTNAAIETSGRSMLYRDLAGQTEDGSAGTLYSLNGNYNSTSSMSTVSFGLTGGLGVGYMFGRNGIWVDGRYDIGLTNIRANESTNGKNNLTTIMGNIAYTYTLFN